MAQKHKLQFLLSAKLLLKFIKIWQKLLETPVFKNYNFLFLVSFRKKYSKKILVFDINPQSKISFLPQIINDKIFSPFKSKKKKFQKIQKNDLSIWHFLINLESVGK